MVGFATYRRKVVDVHAAEAIRYEELERLTKELFAGIPKELFRLDVREPNLAFRAHDEHGVGSGVKQLDVVLSSMDSSVIIGHRGSSGRRWRRGSRLQSKWNRRGLRPRAGRT